MGLFILDSPAPSKDLDTWAQGNTCWKTKWEREKGWCFSVSSDSGIKVSSLDFVFPKLNVRWPD